MHATNFWATDACKVLGKSQMHTTYIPDARNPFNQFTFGLHLLLTPMTLRLATPKTVTRILNYATFTLPTLYSRVWPFHHHSLSNSSNVSGHHLAGSNKLGPSCWSSLVSFVASFSSVRFCHPCHFKLSSYSRLLVALI